MEFKKGDEVEVGWTEKYINAKAFFGIGHNGIKLQGIKGIVYRIVQDYIEIEFSPDPVTGRKDIVWSIPSDCVKPFNQQSSVPIVSSYQLKQKNTESNRTICYVCNNKLKNPLPGSSRFQHCPVCEP